MTENEISQVVVDAAIEVLRHEGRPCRSARTGLKLRSLVLIPELASAAATCPPLPLCALAPSRLCVEKSCHVPC